MSGTSYDAIDAAVADFSIQNDVIRLTPGGAAHYPLPDGLDLRIAAMVKGEPVTAFDLCRLDTEVGQAFAEVAAQFIQDIAGTADLISSHGQTIYHWEVQGRAQGSLQVGNPAWIAERTGLPVVSDIRMRDIAAGGNGAPLASTFDVMLARHRYDQPVGFLNLGGIANMTVVAPGKEPLAYDLGPANTLMDAAIARFTAGRASYDHDGISAAAGNVHDGLMARLIEHAYYRLPIPKSTGKETFGNDYLQALLAEYPDAGMDDVLATFTAHAGKLVADEAKAHGLVHLVASGGGVNNPTLVACIKEHLGSASYTTIDELGMPADAKEAYAFALLGFLTAVGLPGTISSCTGANRPVVLGSITPGSAECLFPYVQSTQVPGGQSGQVPTCLEIHTSGPGA